MEFILSFSKYFKSPKAFQDSHNRTLSQLRQLGPFSIQLHTPLCTQSVMLSYKIPTPAAFKYTQLTCSMIHFNGNKETVTVIILGFNVNEKYNQCARLSLLKAHN